MQILNKSNQKSMEDIVGESILDRFYDEDTMSVHFKENVHILKKKGKPGNWHSEYIEESPSKNYLNNIINQLYKEIEERDDAFLELDRKLSKVLQIGPYRIVISIPPLSDGLEITVVKPLKKLSLEDYNLDKDIENQLRSKSQGILISGAPGEGKTTFAQALIEKYVNDSQVVKTIESPRDLMVPDEVTQYSFSYAPHSEIRDILLLSRPDYTIYDEVRNVDDFVLFKDLRLTGIGLVGVIHATTPVDSIQRFLGTIELGIVPQVIDTVIFIKGGQINEILTLHLSVKVPEGMDSSDLARPVIQVTNFMTQEVKYEIYSYGEQMIVMPLEKVNSEEEKSSPIDQYAATHIENYLREIYDVPSIVQAQGKAGIKLFIPSKYKGQIIGKGGNKINEIEKELGLSISVKTLDEVKTYDVLGIDKESKKGKKSYNLILTLPEEFKNKELKFIVGDEDIFSGKSDINGQVKITNKSILSKIEQKGVSFLE